MKLSCCGNFYLTNGLTFEKISRYTTTAKNRIKPYFKGNKTISETIYVAVCDNCGHYIVSLIRQSNAGVEKETYRGNAADEFFYANYNKFVEMPIISPFADVKQSKSIPYVYGKALNSETQIPRYIDESDNAGSPIDALIRVFRTDFCS